MPRDSRHETQLSKPFDGCRAKANRAEELLSRFEGELQSAIAQYEVKDEDQPDRGRHAFWLVGPEIPLRISVLAGEIIHQCRTALDHLVWAAVEMNGKTPTRETTFPICDSFEKYKKAIERGALKGTPKELSPFVEKYQPFMSDDTANHMLAILQELDNRDKHRFLLITAAAMNPGREIIAAPDRPGFSLILPEAVPGATAFHKAIEDGVEVQWIKYEGPKDGKFNIQCKFGKDIVFPAIGGRARQSVLFALGHIVSLVKGMIEECGALLRG